MQINIEIFYMLVLNLLVSVVGHVQIANQTAEFLEVQYLQEDMMDFLNILYK